MLHSFQSSKFVLARYTHLLIPSFATNANEYSKYADYMWCFLWHCVWQSLLLSAQRLKSTWHLWTPLWRCSAKLTAPLPLLSHGIKTGSRWVNLCASACSVQVPYRSPLSSQAILDDTLALLPMWRVLSAWRWALLYRVSFIKYTKNEQPALPILLHLFSL